MLPFIRQSTRPIIPLPVDGGSSDYLVTRGMIDAGLTVSVLYSANITAAGTAVRSLSLPIKRIILKDESTTLKVWRARDLVTVAQVMEQAPLSSMLVPVSGFAIANYTNLEAHVPLQFRQPGLSGDGDMTALPTYFYQVLTLTIEWGSVGDLLVGAPVGMITFTPNGSVVTQDSYADLKIGDGKKFARTMPQGLDRYLELVQLAVANPAADIDMGTTANLRALVITCELAATGEPTDTLIADLTLLEDTNQPVFSAVPWKTLRASNAKRYGAVLPTGVAIMDFASAHDVGVYKARQKNKVTLRANTNAVAGTIRVEQLAIAPPKAG